MEDRLVNRVIVDTNTGEITQEIFDGDRISIRRESQERYINENSALDDSGRIFGKIYSETPYYLRKVLSLSERDAFYLLSAHVSYTTFIIHKTTNYQSDFAKLEDIAVILDKHYKNTYKIIKGMIDKKVIGRHKTDEIIPRYTGTCKFIYTVNPFLVGKGNFINKSVYDYYRNTLPEIINSLKPDTS